MIKLIIIFLMSIFFGNLPYMYEDEGIYQINTMEYSYTSGYGINEDVRYKIDCEDDCILYIKEYGKDENDLIKIKLSDKDMDKFEAMLNKNHILSWKGFNKSDINVLDGDSFSFRLRYNDDEKLSASGYMKYPNNYQRFKSSFEKYVDSINK